MKPSTLALLVLAASALIVGPVAAQPLADARKAMQAQEFAKAVEILEGDWDNVKANSTALSTLTEAALKAGLYDRCMTYSAQLVQLDEENPVGYRCGAQAFYWRAEEAKQGTGATPGKIKGLYEESKSLNQQYLKLKPKDVEMWSLLGHALYWLEEHEESAKAFDRCATLEPKNAGHINMLARAYRLAGKFDEAARAMDRAIAMDPDNAALIKGKADVLWFKADAAKDAAGYKAAGECYGKALRAKNLDDATASACAQVLWSIYGGSKDWDGGIAQLKGWADAHERNPVPHWWIGWYEQSRANYEAAKAAYEQCWKVSGGRMATGAVGVGDMYWSMAYPKKADGTADFSKSPSDVKMLEEAVKWFCKAQGVSNWNWNGKKNEPVNKCVAIFLACANSGNLDAGAAMLENHALKAAPDNWNILNNLGLYYRDKGGAARDKTLCVKSKDYYVRAAELVLKDQEATNESKARVLNDTGVLFHFPQYQINDMETGMRYYEKALTYEPEDHKSSIGWYDAHENMGLCMNTLGKYEEAIPYFKKVLEREPGRRMSLRGLRTAERELKDK